MTSSTLAKTEEVVHQAAQIGQGRIADNGHPLHPSTVHFPIGLLTFSFGLDALNLARTKAPALIPNILQRWLPSVPASLVTSHYAGAAGVLFAVPTVLTGLAELYEMWRTQAKEKGNEQTAKETVSGQQQKLWTTIRHASMMDITVGIAAYNLYTRYVNAPLNSTAAPFTLPETNLWLSVIGILTMLGGAALGGELVYGFGVGVQRQGKALEKKKQQ